MTTPDPVEPEFEEPEVEEIVIADLAAEEPKSVRRHATQDAKVAHDIREARRKILKLRELPEAAALMAGHAYDEARLEEGMALYHVAFDAFDARSDAITRKQHAAAHLRGADLTAREIYADYKGVCRVFFPEEPDWTALAVEGATPRPRSGFILKARDAYATGQRPPYDYELSRHGFGGETLQLATATADATDQADATYRAEIELAKQATKTRDKATDKLRKWAKKFEAVLQVVLKGHPSLVEILGPAS